METEERKSTTAIVRSDFNYTIYFDLIIIIYTLLNHKMNKEDPHSNNTRNAHNNNFYFQDDQDKDLGSDLSS